MKLSLSLVAIGLSSQTRDVGDHCFSRELLCPLGCSLLPLPLRMLLLADMRRERTGIGDLDG